MSHNMAQLLAAVLAFSPEQKEVLQTAWSLPPEWKEVFQVAIANDLKHQGKEEIFSAQSEELGQMIVQEYPGLQPKIGRPRKQLQLPLQLVKEEKEVAPEFPQTQEEKLLEYIQQHPGCKITEAAGALEINCIYAYYLGNVLARKKLVTWELEVKTTKKKGNPAKLFFPATESLVAKSGKMGETRKDQLLSYIQQHPGCSILQAANELKINTNFAQKNIVKLYLAGEVTYQFAPPTGKKGIRPKLWYLKSEVKAA